MNRENVRSKEVPLIIRYGDPLTYVSPDLTCHPRLADAFEQGNYSSQDTLINISAAELCSEGSDAALLTQVQDRSVLVLEYAYGFLPLEYLLLIPWAALRCKVATVELAGLTAQEQRELKKLVHSAGLRPAGGGLRATGTDVLFERSDRFQEYVAITWRQSRFRVGRLIVWMRSHVTYKALRRARRKRLMSMLDPRVKRSLILDKNFGMPLEPVSLMESKSVAFSVRETSHRTFRVDVPDDEGVESVARECFARLGVWPISFSFPKIRKDPPPPLHQSVSSIIPGEPYSFISPSEYLNEYASSQMAITHRKAGWDCFRHVEILASGSIPLVLDVEAIPKYSMIHYPKKSLAIVTEQVRAPGGVPDSTTRAGFQKYFQHHLTSRSMADYMLRMADLRNSQRVLFVDEALPFMPDYQSLLALIGLKQLLGQSCEVFSPVDYLYEDWAGETDRLYGRGFNYTRVLDSTLRSQSEGGEELGGQIGELLSERYDALVVGSISRNWSRAEQLLEVFPRERTVWIYGEDSPPDIEESARLRGSKVHIFVRSINT